MSKKLYDIIIEVNENTWSTATAFVEAESLEEAIKLFKDDPWAYEWQDWETHDSELLAWEVSNELSATFNLRDEDTEP